MRTDTERLDWLEKQDKEWARMVVNGNTMAGLRAIIDQEMDQETPRPPPITLSIGTAKATMKAEEV